MLRAAGAKNSSAHRHLHCFQRHARFGDLRGSGLSANLQLAAIYAATASLLPFRSSEKTGHEVALELLGRCWVNRPLTAAEASKVKNLLSLCTPHEPTLEIRCWELLKSAQQLHFLHNVASQELRWMTRATVSAKYKQGASFRYRSPRRMLPADEETRILGEATPTPWLCSAFMRVIDNIDQSFLVELPECPCPLDFVAKAERELASFGETHGSIRQLLRRTPRSAASNHPFPLQGAQFETTNLGALGAMMVNELRTSWERNLTDACSEGSQLPSDPSHFARRLAEVGVKRKELELQLLGILHVSTSSVFHSGLDLISGRHQLVAFCMLRDANVLPTASLDELARVACGDADVRSFNPFLSKQAHNSFVTRALLWLQLCVLEDRCARAYSHALNGNEPLLRRELQTTRIWDVNAHPKWLIFEAESGLQIRPVQYETARTMMENPALLVQLNMGEGKTKVIVPMLVLHWADGTQVVQVNALSSILRELQEHMQQHLTASLLMCKVFMLPFHRNVQLDCAAVNAMISSVEYCRRSRGVLLVAPEHRLSLILKWHEKYASGEIELCGVLDHLAAIPKYELLDESDEILRHKYQLIYACGGAVALPNGAVRWQTLQAILEVMNTNATVKSLLEGIAIYGDATPEAFLPFRLKPIVDGDDSRNQNVRIYNAIMEHLLTDPPFELRWIKTYQCRKQDIFPFLTVPSACFLPGELPAEHRTAFLALRCYLACGVLRHALTKRHNVEYGINPNGSKHLAVPFRNSHTPTDRSEFGHPDIAIALTNLSYYYDGLTIPQVTDAFMKLLEYKGAAQNFYALWFELSKARMLEEGADWQSVERCDQLDLLASVAQRELCARPHLPRPCCHSPSPTECVSPRPQAIQVLPDEQADD